MKRPMKKPMILAACLLLCSCFLLLSTDAYAEEASTHERHWRGPISIAEVQLQSEQRFVEADIDGDGMITAAEFDEAKMERPRGPIGRSLHRRQRDNLRHGDDMEAEIFTEMDTDGSGELSAEEFSEQNRHAARMVVMKRQMFSTLDENDDNVITRDEFDARTKHLKELDTDGNGEVTREELRGHFPGHSAAGFPAHSQKAS